MRGAAVRYRSLFDRLMMLSAFNPSNGCWEWIGGKTPDGYGRINICTNGKVHATYAHRVMFEQEKFGTLFTISEGYDVDHLCKNRCCINPDHLQLRYYKFHRQETGYK